MNPKIEEMEAELKKTSYNKATEAHVGRLKARIARLKRGSERLSSSSKRKGVGYGVKKTGDATVAMIGPPSVGKSSLLNQLTDQNSKVAAYDFTTLDTISGMMYHNGAAIQVIDLPGLILGASSGKGLGSRVLSVAKTADLLLLVVDQDHRESLDILRHELHISGIRLNKRPPQISINVLDRSGISIIKTHTLDFSDTTIISVLREYKIHNADVRIREQISLDDLIDVLEGNRQYIRAITVLNKADLMDVEATERSGELLISALKGDNLDLLRDEIFNELDLIRVYLKKQGNRADLDTPMILKRGDTVREVCRKIHRRFVKGFRYAQVWGSSVRFPAQQVGLNHRLEDGDVLTVVAEKSF